MNKSLMVATILFFSVIDGSSFAQDKQNTPPPAKIEKKEISKQEILTNVKSIKDPFIPQLPVAPIVKSQQNSSQYPGNAVSASASGNQMNNAPPPVEVRPPVITISGLVWNTDRPQAIVNNQIVEIGDKINEWTIVTIHEEGIEIVYKDKIVVVSNQFDK